MFRINRDSNNLFTVVRNQKSICSKVSEAEAQAKVEGMGYEWLSPTEDQIDKWIEVPECRRS